MTASENRSPYVASEASDASMLRMTEEGIRRQDSGAVFPSLFRVWGTVLRAFDAMFVQPLKTWMRLGRDVAGLHGWDDRDLRDIGITRSDIAAIRAGTNKRASPDSAERILVCPEAGKPESQTPTEHDPGERTVRWDERPPQIII